MNRKRNIAFIDGQNLYCGIRDGGWKLDYGKSVSQFSPRIRILFTKV